MLRSLLQKIAQGNSRTLCWAVSFKKLLWVTPELYVELKSLLQEVAQGNSRTLLSTHLQEVAQGNSRTLCWEVSFKKLLWVTPELYVELKSLLQEVAQGNSRTLLSTHLQEVAQGNSRTLCREVSFKNLHRITPELYVENSLLRSCSG